MARIVPLLAISLLAGGCGGARSSDTAKVPAPPTCTPHPQVQAEETAVAERNQAAFARALAEQGLREPDFTSDYFDSSDAAGREWQVVDDAEGRTLLAPVSYLSCGVSNPWRLAQDGSGGVSALVISDRPTTTQHLAICGCQVDIPITCGGAAPQPVRWRWRMPASTKWNGPLSVVVDRETLTTSFAGRGDGKVCPTPTAPP